MPIDMTKRTEKAFISLQKAADAATSDPGNVEVNLVLAIDYSLSMNDGDPNSFYTNGDMQELAENILGLAMTGLDANKQVEVYPFHNHFYPPFTVDETNYSGCIERWRRTPQADGRRPQFGGTNYLPVIDQIVADAEQRGELSPGSPPLLIVFQTDGATSNRKAVQDRIVALRKRAIFIVFVGLGNNTLFLKFLDELPGGIDNVALVSFSGIVGLDPEKLYDGLLHEFITKYLPRARQLGIVTN